MDPRSVAEWKTVFGRLPSPEGTPVEQVVAQRVLGDLVGYRHASRYRKQDGAELANAMQAWAEMTAHLAPTSDEVPAQYRDGRNMDGSDA